MKCHLRHPGKQTCKNHFALKRFIACLMLACLCILNFGLSFAASTVYTQRSANGSMIFSDAPVVNGDIQRSSYQSFGRPVATSSCIGLSAAQMATRAVAVDKDIENAAATHKLDADLLRAIAEVESCYDINAVSRVGAQGVMQLMPATAKELGVSNSFDAAQNINGGAKYLAEMLSRFGQNHQLALAAYNAGPGAVEKHDGVPPYPETRDYINKVLGIYTAE